MQGQELNLERRKSVQATAYLRACMPSEQKQSENLSVRREQELLGGDITESEHEINKSCSKNKITHS